MSMASGFSTSTCRPLLERSDGEGGVGPRGCGDDDDVDVGIGEDAVEVGGDRRRGGGRRRGARRRPSELSADGCEARRLGDRRWCRRGTCRTPRIRRVRGGGGHDRWWSRPGPLEERCSDAGVGHAVEHEVAAFDRGDGGGEHDVGHRADLFVDGLGFEEWLARCGRGRGMDRRRRAASPRRCTRGGPAGTGRSRAGRRLGRRGG